ncbi:PorP/SprF family type IX secretion system membrane protein [Foetidibacter luteolus]|uniref:PorP/SprF family type IX secretion system membrane protein n=1 Tax=Foetidibacter luteolus TaxID=2608880 RepID=UPI00129C09AD|nr:type IX secretion system membrane protein PorP/SprF [Foetidibacter luteolus]
MKLKLTVLVFFTTAFFVNAQQRPHYTQYVLNNFIINPAVAGIEDYWDVKASHRHQWVGLEGAPVTTYVTVQGPLRKSAGQRENATTIKSPGENPRGQAYWNDYTATDPHAGIGFTVINDRAGPLNRFAAYGTYSYHLPIAARTSLSAGISVGFQNMSLDNSKLDFGSGNPVDPAVASSGYLNKVRPDISAGLWLYSRDYFIGLAAQQIVPSRLTYADEMVKTTEGRLIPHMFLSAGYRFLLGEDFSFLPSTMIKYISSAPVSFDLNAKLQYQDFIWAGASYRNKDGYAAMVGVNVSSKFNFGYSYDITTSALNTISRGTHEILIGFLIGNNYDDWCPRNLW